METLPLFDHALWMKANQLIDGGRCHKIANVMSVYSTSHKLMAEFGIQSSWLKMFNDSAKELQKTITSSILQV